MSTVINYQTMSVREFSDYDSISSWALELIQWAINETYRRDISHKVSSTIEARKRAEGKHYYSYMTAGSAKLLRIYYARVKEHLNSLYDISEAGGV